MFKIGDRVRHKTTGINGEVIGYGSRQVSDRKLTTLKVELGSYSPIASTAEDLLDRWQSLPDRRIRACTLPHFPIFQRSLSKTA